jgi:hypothetical protein
MKITNAEIKVLAELIANKLQEEQLLVRGLVTGKPLESVAHRASIFVAQEISNFTKI